MNKKYAYAGIGIAVVLIIIMTLEISIKCDQSVTGEVTSEIAGENLLSFAESQGIEGEVELKSIESFNDFLYEATLLIDEQELPVFVTKDGKYMVTEPISLDYSPQQIPNEPQEVNDGSTDNSEISDLNSNPDKLTIYFFWGDGCPHCAEEKPFLEELEEKYGGDIEVKMFETYYDQVNQQLFQEVANAYGIQVQGVPTTFIGDKNWVGYADYMGEEIEDYVKYCIENKCESPLEAN